MKISPHITSAMLNQRQCRCYVLYVLSRQTAVATCTLCVLHWFKRHILFTDMRRLTTGIGSEKCVVRRCRRCANVIQCTYTNPDSTV